MCSLNAGRQEIKVVGGFHNKVGFAWGCSLGRGTSTPCSVVMHFGAQTAQHGVTGLGQCLQVRRTEDGGLS